MNALRPFSVQFLDKTNLNPEDQHSILISTLRGLAAVQVLAAHLRAQLFPGLSTLPDPSLWYQVLAFFTGFSHQAVVVFFLLSGWLVGGSLLNRLREPGIMLTYAIDRLTRLWMVLIPCLLITLAIGAYVGVVDPGRLSFAPANEYSATAFVGNLFGLQEMAVPRYGANFPLWSLANETWYYALFPLLVLVFAARRVPAKLAAAITLMVTVWFLSFEIVLYSGIWLLGVLASRVRINAGRAVRAIFLLVLAAVAVYYRFAGNSDTLTTESFFQDLMFGLAFVLFLASQQFKADQTKVSTRVAAGVGGVLAPFSFTLYVIHVPLLVLLRYLHEPLRAGQLSPDRITDLFVYEVMFAVILVLAYILYLPFEAQTYRVRHLLKRVASRSVNFRKKGLALR